MASSSKRGLSVITTTPKRVCADLTNWKLNTLSKRQAPRGIHSKIITESTTSKSTSTLQQLLKDRAYVYIQGQEKIFRYIEQNTTLEIQKAVALNIFVLSLGDGDCILSACNVASRYTGFCVEVIRRWAESIFGEFFGVLSNIDNVDTETDYGALIR